MELELEFDEKELLKKGYLKVWMLFEVQSNSYDVTEKALAKHIAAIKKTYDIYILEENLTSIDEVEAGAEFKARNINVLFSQICEITFMLKNYETLVDIVINYGPTSVEIIAPEKITLNMREAQSSLMAVAEMMHKFAAQGIGGIVIKT
ncbi:MAG: hypothetical protein DRN66_04110 [Candidatus Nanohalarchaeota archaeon]|nr:MAG: hypothetical protein DRN66_04110 [Candidatus Nanohaloarchaeota archaeon]